MDKRHKLYNTLRTVDQQCKKFMQDWSLLEILPIIRNLQATTVIHSYLPHMCLNVSQNCQLEGAEATLVFLSSLLGYLVLLLVVVWMQRVLVDVRGRGIRSYTKLSVSQGWQCKPTNLQKVR